MPEELTRLVDEGIKLDGLVKESKKRLNEIKAELTNIAFDDMDNKNLKYKQIFGKQGHFNCSYKQKLEIDNYEKLVELLGEIAAAKVSREENIKYKVDARFKNALIAVFNGEYNNEITIEEVLTGFGIDDKAIKTARKRLKGDYIKDKKVLESLGITGDCEEELYTIKLCKNYELVDRFFGSLSEGQMELLKKAVFVDDGISVGFEYQDD